MGENLTLFFKINETTVTLRLKLLYLWEKKEQSLYLIELIYDDVGGIAGSSRLYNNMTWSDHTSDHKYQTKTHTTHHYRIYTPGS